MISRRKNERQAIACRKRALYYGAEEPSTMSSTAFTSHNNTPKTGFQKQLFEPYRQKATSINPIEL